MENLTKCQAYGHPHHHVDGACPYRCRKCDGRLSGSSMGDGEHCACRQPEPAVALVEINAQAA